MSASSPFRIRSPRARWQWSGASLARLPTVSPRSAAPSARRQRHPQKRYENRESPVKTGSNQEKSGEMRVIKQWAALALGLFATAANAEMFAIQAGHVIVDAAKP